jgi:inner membrane protein YidH
MTAESPKAPEETIRLHQANERTMLAWIRTGIALMAFGFAIARFGLFLRQIASMSRLSVHPEQGLGSAWIGAALVGFGMLVNLLGTLRYAQIRRAIERGALGAPGDTIVIVIGAIATLIGLGMTALLIRALGE